MTNLRTAIIAITLASSQPYPDSSTTTTLFSGPPPTGTCVDFVDPLHQQVELAPDFHIGKEVLEARKQAFAEAIAAIKKLEQDFLSEQYATPQPMGSIQERFALGEAMTAIKALGEK